MDDQTLNGITGKILDAAIMVHRHLGPGLLESIYETCLIDELNQRGLIVEAQKNIPVIYRGKALNKDFRIDLLVDGCVIIEIKAVDHVLPVHEAQIISYLRLSNKKIGLLINFNVVLLKEGFKRYYNPKHI